MRRVHPTILHEVMSRRRRGHPGSVERRGTGIATPSSRRRVDGGEDDATIQHESAVKLISTPLSTRQSPIGWLNDEASEEEANIPCISVTWSTRQPPIGTLNAEAE